MNFTRADLRLFLCNQFSSDSRDYLCSIAYWSKKGSASEKREEAALKIKLAVAALWMKRGNELLEVDLGDLNLKSYPPILEGLNIKIGLQKTIAKENASSIIAFNILTKRGLKEGFLKKLWPLVEANIKELSQYHEELEAWGKEGEEGENRLAIVQYLEDKLLEINGDSGPNTRLKLDCNSGPHYFGLDSGRSLRHLGKQPETVLKKAPPLSFFREHLDRLELAHNALKGHIELKYSKLTHLNLSFNHLKEFPDLEGCNELTSLDLSGNPLRENLNLENLKKVPSLRYLHLKNANLRKAPDLEGCNNLTWLDLSNNPLGENLNLANLKKLPSLWFLILRNTSLRTAPDLEGCNTLNSLDLSDNPLGDN